MKKFFTKPYVYSLIAVVISVCVGLGVGFWLPPNSFDVTSAYESGLSDGQSAAAEDYSHQLEAERSSYSSQLAEEQSLAEQRLESALESQESRMLLRQASLVSEASSHALEQGKKIGANQLFAEMQLENPYTGEIIYSIEDYNEYVSQYLEESAQYDDGSYNSVTVYWTPNGKSYHASPYCATLNHSNTILEGTIDEAIASGHGDPCDVCY